MTYTSINNQKIKELKKLQTKKYRDQKGLFIIEGDHLIKEAYSAGILKEVIILEELKLNLAVPISYANREVIKYLSSVDTPQNMIGICEKQEQKEITNKVIALDNIQDPGNLGAIIRSALAFNIDTILLSNDTVDLYNSKVIRASQGMMFKLNIIRIDLKEKIKELKQNGYQILTTNVKDGKDIKTLEKQQKICIIVGNEGNGVSCDLQELSDEHIYIKMNTNCESLNVAVATSIILYELGSE